MAGRISAIIAAPPVQHGCEDLPGAFVLPGRHHLLAWADLEDAAVAHDHDAVRDVTCEVHFVGDDEHGHALVREIAHDREYLQPDFGVEGRRWLVEEHDLRGQRQRTGNGDALLLAS
jgi:hypothetical protein